MSKLRLDKYLADMGVGTRQEVKALVRKGRVAVDGITAKAPELKVDPDEAQVTVDGNSISYVKMEYSTNRRVSSLRRRTAVTGPYSIF